MILSEARYMSVCQVVGGKSHGQLETMCFTGTIKFSPKWFSLNYRPQRSCKGYVFTVFTGVCLSTGGRGCLPQCMVGYHPPGAGTPPRADTLSRSRHPPGNRHTPWEQTPPQSRYPPGSRHPPPPGTDTPRSRHSLTICFCMRGYFKLQSFAQETKMLPLSQLEH